MASARRGGSVGRHRQPARKESTVYPQEAEGQKEDPKRISLAASHSPETLVNAALPYLKQLDPRRVRAVTNALRHLQTLRAEGAVLMMHDLVVEQ